MSAPMTAVCCYCNCTADSDHELRPYGPGGAWLCFDCMMADPAREATAKEVFGAMLDAAGPVSILTENGPMPFLTDTTEGPQ